MSASREALFRVFRGTEEQGQLEEYRVEIVPGMVVLDAIINIQAEHAPDLGIRCNCTAGKCGSCSAEINGIPRLMCKTRIGDLELNKPITVRPLKSFPIIKDLVTNISRNYELNKQIPPFKPKPGTDWKMYQYEVDRVQEFRKCIECFLCQDTCHVIRVHDKEDVYFGPRYFVRLAGLAMHPLDEENRLSFIKELAGIAWCNVTKCCTELCPETIKITDNAIIPLKERVASKYYDPLRMLIRALAKKRKQ